MEKTSKIFCKNKSCNELLGIRVNNSLKVGDLIIDLKVSTDLVCGCGYRTAFFLNKTRKNSKMQKN